MYIRNGTRYNTCPHASTDLRSKNVSASSYTFAKTSIHDIITHSRCYATSSSATSPLILYISVEMSIFPNSRCMTHITYMKYFLSLWRRYHYRFLGRTIGTWNIIREQTTHRTKWSGTIWYIKFHTIDIYPKQQENTTSIPPN